MQFIPSTWKVYAPSQDADPQNIKDAAKATAKLLCAVSQREHRPLTDPDVEEAAIRAYNNDATYVDMVRGFAGDFSNVSPGPAAGGHVDVETIAERLGSEGRARWEALGSRISAVPGRQLDRAYGVFDPLADVLWTTLGSDPSTIAAAASASEGVAKASNGNVHIMVDASIVRQVAHLLYDAEHDGVILQGSGYRTAEQQAELRRINGCPDLDSPSDTCRVPTAPVGHSNHEKGLAIDFTDRNGVSLTRGSPEFQWLEANAARYGLHNLPSEPWHWSVDGH